MKIDLEAVDFHYFSKSQAQEGGKSLGTPVLSDCTTSAAERVMCYLMDLWGRLCLAIVRLLELSAAHIA